MQAGKRVLVTLAALAAISAAALVAPALAAAEETGLCKTDTLSNCNNVSHVHEVSVEKAKLLSKELNVECDVLFLGDVGKSGAPLHVTGNFTYSNCNDSCKVKEKNGPALIEVLKEGNHLAAVTGEGLVELNCLFGFIKCSYDGTGLEGHGLDPLKATGTNGRITLSEQETTQEAGSETCEPGARLDLTTEPLENTYIAGVLSPTSTSLSTSLKGGGKEGTEITVAEGSKVKDTATLSGEHASEAGGTVDFAVYKDKECKELVTEAGKVTVKEGKVPDSEEKELEAGREYFWQARYLGDSMNNESTSTCSKEVLTVLESHKTALCAADDAGSTCLEEHKPSSVDLKDSAVEFLTNILNSKCEGLISSSSIGAAGKPQIVTAEYTFKSCTNGCVITEVSGGSKLNFLYESIKEGSELASVATEGLEIFVKCGETVKCTFGPVKAPVDALGALKTGDNGHVTFSKASLGTGEGPLCPKEAGLDALYVASSALYIREKYSPTSLCSKDEGSPVCKSENQLKTIDYKDKALELLTNLINVKCEGLASGSVGEPGGTLEVKPELTFTGCGGGCFVTSVAGPGKVVLERSKSEEAQATAEDFEIFVKCGTTIKCLLGPEKLSGTALGSLASGDNGRLTFGKASLGKGEGATCPTEATLDATYVASSAAYIG